MFNPLRRSTQLRLGASLVIGAAFLLVPAPALGVSKDMVQLQTQVQQLQDAVARLQQSNDERMGVMKDLVQQSADAVNKMSINLDAMQKRTLAQQEGQNGKIDQVSGQLQSLNDSLDEVKARLSRLEKLTQDIQNQQQSMSANLPGLPQSSGPAPAQNSGPAPAQAISPTPQVQAPSASYNANPLRKGKPMAGIPATSLPPTLTTAAPGAPSADDLYKTALGDYMSAKYPLASSEFSDVIKNYPQDPLAGNAYYYQAEIQYRASQYAPAVKNYDKVLEQYPDNNKVPVAHLHKGQALLALKQNDAGVRELRALIQRFPNSPEAMSARSKLNGMGVTLTPRRTTP